MRKIIISFAFIALFASCTGPQQLYSWGKYEKTSYDYLKKSDEVSTQLMLEDYQKIINKQTGTRGVVPPGIYADYGFLLIQGGKKEEGEAMLLKEIALYPESSVFIERIIKMIKE